MLATRILTMQTCVEDIKNKLEDCHQSCRKHSKAGAESSIALPLDEVELAEKEVSV